MTKDKLQAICECQHFKSLHKRDYCLGSIGEHDCPCDKYNSRQTDKALASCKSEMGSEWSADKFIDGIVADARDNLDTIVIATLIADKFNIPMWYLRKRKEHGRQKEIEGDEKLFYKMIKEGKKLYTLKYITEYTK